MLVLTFSVYSRAGTEVVPMAIPVEIESLRISDKGLK
jgi:hypothetical protein